MYHVLAYILSHNDLGWKGPLKSMGRDIFGITKAAPFFSSQFFHLKVGTSALQELDFMFVRQSLLLSFLSNTNN